MCLQSPFLRRTVGYCWYKTRAGYEFVPICAELAGVVGIKRELGMNLYCNFGVNIREE